MDKNIFIPPTKKSSRHVLIKFSVFVADSHFINSRSVSASQNSNFHFVLKLNGLNNKNLNSNTFILKRFCSRRQQS